MVNASSNLFAVMGSQILRVQGRNRTAPYDKMLAGSAPFTLGGVYLIVRRTLNGMKGEGEKKAGKNEQI